MNSLLRSTLHGSLGFAAVSVAAYSIWAFAPRIAGSEIGMYALIALVFLGGAGLALNGLLHGENRMRRFYRLFLPAFFGYALLWSVAWFLIKEPPGGWRLREWIGAAAGTLFFAWVAWNSLDRARGFWIAALLLFVLHTAGYFIGGKWMYGISKVDNVTLAAAKHFLEGLTRQQLVIVAKLGWGLFHGLGFGAGIGFALGWWQRSSK
jgi:hypothetical protein